MATWRQPLPCLIWFLLPHGLLKQNKKCDAYRYFSQSSLDRCPVLLKDHVQWKACLPMPGSFEGPSVGRERNQIAMIRRSECRILPLGGLFMPVVLKHFSSGPPSENDYLSRTPSNEVINLEMMTWPEVFNKTYSQESIHCSLSAPCQITRW